MAYIIAEPCIGTEHTACVGVCPVDCHPARSRDYQGGPECQGTKNLDEVPQLYINPQECIDYGAYVPVCPVTAIFVLEDLTEKLANYTQINADYFKPAAGQVATRWASLYFSARQLGHCGRRGSTAILTRQHAAGKLSD